MARQIRRVSRWHYRVPQKVVSYYQSRLDLLSEQVGLVPHSRSGQMVGFRLTYLSRRSVIRRVGFRRGDIITAVNHYKLLSMPQVMLAYFALRRQTTFLINILHRGKKRKLRVEIR